MFYTKGVLKFKRPPPSNTISCSEAPLQLNDPQYIMKGSGPWSKYIIKVVFLHRLN